MGRTETTNPRQGAHQGERPCYANSHSHLLPQLLSARWRWLPPPRRRTGRAAEWAAALVAFIITTSAPASASATSVATRTDAMGPAPSSPRSAIACAPSTSADIDLNFAFAFEKPRSPQAA